MPRANLPVYRVKVIIYDEQTDERATVTDEPLYSSEYEIDRQAARTQYLFRIKDQRKFEDTHYPELNAKT